jgi:Flp pilus assembly protein TadG
MAGTDGSALVEFTIFAPLMVVMGIYMMDFGLLIWHKMQVQHAAQAGAEYAISHSGYNSASIALVVTNTIPSTRTFTITASPAPSQFCGCPSNTGVTSTGVTNGDCHTSSCAGAAAGNYVTVSATAAYNSFAPWGNTLWGPVIAGSYNLTAQATVRVQ